MKISVTFSDLEPGLPAYEYRSTVNALIAQRLSDPSSAVGKSQLPRVVAQAMFDAGFQLCMARRIRALKAPAPEPGTKEWAALAGEAYRDVEASFRDVIGEPEQPPKLKGPEAVEPTPADPEAPPPALLKRRSARIGSLPTEQLLQQFGAGGGPQVVDPDMGGGS